CARGDGSYYFDYW
nr:immunoglobulin heavy chain junction region [Mus musculus]NSM04650.1 immunoglobulin heavy chain junction region [Mus musculus]NSM06081.1 immunoglobulin heavy chain junction region [Mus musculus]NSM06193.1 immunoglobulin heavy chain junction region [Mus musculus]NSM06232.1 immunoglobulin heavy chain junction region [Mus musculus]